LADELVRSLLKVESAAIAKEEIAEVSSVFASDRRQSLASVYGRRPATAD
jgi:hypothetical protein